MGKYFSAGGKKKIKKLHDLPSIIDGVLKKNRNSIHPSQF